MGKLFIAIGVLLVLVGVIVEVGGRFLPFGSLPGDIHITGEHGSFSFPIVSCIIISIILSVLLNLFHR